MVKVNRMQMREILSRNFSHISATDRDEMAIPSYLHWNPLIRWLMWKRYETINGMIDINSCNASLEFGCGIGLFLPELSHRFQNVYAIDIYPDYAMELCRELSLKVTFINSMSNIDDNSLDVIIAADVLEHVDDLTGALKEFNLKLKEKGKLIISGPTENFAYRLGRFLAGFSGKSDYHHTNIAQIISTACSLQFSEETSIKLPGSFLPSLFKVSRLTKRTDN